MQNKIRSIILMFGSIRNADILNPRVGGAYTFGADTQMRIIPWRDIRIVYEKRGKNETPQLTAGRKTPVVSFLLFSGLVGVPITTPPCIYYNMKVPVSVSNDGAGRCRNNRKFVCSCVTPSGNSDRAEFRGSLYYAYNGTALDNGGGGGGINDVRGKMYKVTIKTVVRILQVCVCVCVCPISIPDNI